MRSEGLVISTHPPLSKMERKKRRFLLFQGFDGLMCFRALCLFSGFITLIITRIPQKIHAKIWPFNFQPHLTHLTHQQPSTTHLTNYQPPRPWSCVKPAEVAGISSRAGPLPPILGDVMTEGESQGWLVWVGLYPSNLSDHLNISITKEMGTMVHLMYFFSLSIYISILSTSIYTAYIYIPDMLDDQLQLTPIQKKKIDNGVSPGSPGHKAFWGPSPPCTGSPSPNSVSANSGAGVFLGLVNLVMWDDVGFPKSPGWLIGKLVG